MQIFERQTEIQRQVYSDFGFRCTHSNLAYTQGRYNRQY